MATARAVIEEATRIMLGTTNEQMNKLAAGVAANATTLTFTYPLSGIQAGSFVTIDLETFRVWSVNPDTQSAVVEPAMQGTTSAIHATDALVYVNPRISKPAAFKALNDELIDLSSPTNGLFRMKSIDITPTSGLAYDLVGASDLVAGYEVRQKQPSYNQWMTVPEWRVVASSDPVAFPSGVALELPNVSPNWQVRFNYKAKFSPVVLLDDDLAAVAGLPTDAHDIPHLGILMRLGPVREIQRNFTEAQGSSRRAEEVQSGAVTNSYRSVAALRESRINAEAARLMRLYPSRRAAQ